MMKDKLQGLVIGLTIGTLLTGTVAFANSTQIEVLFRNVKLMFDGVEKAPSEGSTFIYEGNTYVPLRFISETLGKEVKWDEESETIWIGKYFTAEQQKVAATYNGGKVTRAELDTYVAVNRLFFPNAPDNETLLRQLITYSVLASRADDETKEKAIASAKSQYSNIKANSGGFLDNLAKQNITENEVQQYLIRRTQAIHALENQLDDAAYQQEYDRILKDNPLLLTSADVRHILIDKSTRTQEEALSRAKEVIAKLNTGKDFAELAKEYSDDPGSKDNGGLYTNADLNQFVEPFKKASFELPLKQVSEPVLTTYGYHVIKVEDRKVKSLEEAKQLLTTFTLDAKFQQFTSEELPTIIESIDL